MDDNINVLLAGYVLGNLTPEELVQVKQLLDTRPELAAEITSLQTTLALLPLSLPATSPPKELRSRIITAVIKPLPQKANKKNWWIIIGGAIATIIITYIGYDNYNLRQQIAQLKTRDSKHQTQIAQLNQQLNFLKTNETELQQVINLLKNPNNRLLTLKGMSPDSATTSGSLVISPSSEKALLAIQNLPPLPPGKVYQMWAVMNGTKIYCITFKPDSQGKIILKIPSKNWVTTTSVMITVEPDQDMNQPTGEMVIMGTSAI